MTDSTAKGTTISLGDGFGTVVVQGGGIKVELNDNGDVTVRTNGNVITKPLQVNDTPRKKTASEIGDTMPDGTIYAGISPETGKPLFTTPADAPLTHTFHGAQEFALFLEAHDHGDWRVPTRSELHMLFNNRAAIGGFNETGSDPAGRYWSSSPVSEGAGRAQRFSDGEQVVYDTDEHSSLRCVR